MNFRALAFSGVARNTVEPRLNPQNGSAVVSSISPLDIAYPLVWLLIAPAGQRCPIQNTYITVISLAYIT